MEEKISELRVIQERRDGRRKFDERSKRTLVEACLKPGTSVARMAQIHGVNANLLRKWIARYLMEREQSREQGHADERTPPDDVSFGGVFIDVPAPPAGVAAMSKPQSAFVPVVAAPAPTTNQLPASAMAIVVHVRLPNGVEVNLGEANLEELTTIVQMLGRLPCSGSTTT